MGAKTQKKWGPEGWSPERWGPEGWGPKISRFFFPSPATKFVLFFPLWGSSRTLKLAKCGLAKCGHDHSTRANFDLGHRFFYLGPRNDLGQSENLGVEFYFGKRNLGQFWFDLLTIPNVENKKKEK